MTERIDLIGALPSEGSEFFGTRGKYSVFVNSNSQIQIVIESLVELEQGYQKEKYFTGYVSHFMDYGIEEDYDNHQINRSEDLKAILSQYLIVFQPVSMGNYLRVENVALTIKPSFYEDGMSFVSIPYFRTHHSIEAFVDQIYKKGGLRNISSIESCRHIPYVLWQQEGSPYVYIIGNKDGFRQWQGKLQISNQKLDYFQLDNYEKQHMILNPRNEDEELGFVACQVHEQLLQYFIQQQISVPPSQSIQRIESEQTFLNVLQQRIESAHFTYGEKDLMNFHTAMKSNGFVILEGMSGTGKSRLVDFYRQALGLKEEQYKFVSVRSSWTDESDLLGYPDMMNQVYRPDHEGVVDLLIHAEQHPEAIHLLCLDEMNLAKVEHYLSQFLSVLEMQEEEQWISLYNTEVALKNKDKYPPRIQLKGNILFVGTINRDESTHHFSDKVLDRANVIHLSVASLKKLYEMMHIPQQDKLCKCTDTMSYTHYKGMCSSGKGMYLSEAELDVIEAIHQLLREGCWDKGIGYRILKQIDHYMSNLPACQTALSRGEALDLQIKQRILSKLRGDRSSFEGILVEKDGTSIPLIRCLEKYNDVSDFEVSKKVIYEKVKELNSYGYTM